MKNGRKRMKKSNPLEICRAIYENPYSEVREVKGEEKKLITIKSDGNICYIEASSNENIEDVLNSEKVGTTYITLENFKVGQIKIEKDYHKVSIILPRERIILSGEVLPNLSREDIDAIEIVKETTDKGVLWDGDIRVNGRAVNLYDIKVKEAKPEDIMKISLEEI